MPNPFIEVAYSEDAESGKLGTDIHSQTSGTDAELRRCGTGVEVIELAYRMPIYRKRIQPRC